ncbi:hypothetical protein [Faecalicatena orotica]|uniref:hypothetical protein n=1 Tax=Faecalicatena orotica TaxID=1544 RepID=UPI0032172E18
MKIKEAFVSKRHEEEREGYKQEESPDVQSVMAVTGDFFMKGSTVKNSFEIHMVLL